MPATPRPVRRYLRSLRHPNIQDWYGWYDPRSWAVANRVRAELHPSRGAVRDARTVLARGRAGGRFLATLPRSGSHYLASMLDAAHALERGEDGDYDYVTGFRLSGDPAWIPRGQPLVWPVATGSLVQLAERFHGERTIAEAPVLVGHHPMGVGIVEMDVEPGRPVVLVRHPKAAARSMARKRGLGDLATDERHATFLARRYIGWFDTWARARAADPDGRILLVRYEDLEADPAAVLGQISEHWRMGLSDRSREEAVVLCSKERMADKTGHDPTNVRVTLEGAAPVDRGLLDHVGSLIDAELRDPLGYDLADPTGAG